MELIVTDAFIDQLRDEGRMDLGDGTVLIHVPYLTPEDLEEVFVTKEERIDVNPKS